jgi:hypothetical protein
MHEPSLRSPLVEERCHRETGQTECPATMRAEVISTSLDPGEKETIQRVWVTLRLRDANPLRNAGDEQKGAHISHLQPPSFDVYSLIMPSRILRAIPG